MLEAHPTTAQVRDVPSGDAHRRRVRALSWSAAAPLRTHSSAARLSVHRSAAVAYRVASRAAFRCRAGHRRATQAPRRVAHGAQSVAASARWGLVIQREAPVWVPGPDRGASRPAAPGSL